MDISFDFDDNKLNVRTSAIIIHENKLLVHVDSRDDFFAIPGGRIALGENSEDALKREFFEEQGKKIEITGYVTTIENFFPGGNMNYHEIMFVHKAEYIDEKDKLITDTIKNIEGHDYLTYQWIDLDKIDSYNIKPGIIKEILKKNIFPVHVVNDDLKGVYSYGK